MSFGVVLLCICCFSDMVDNVTLIVTELVSYRWLLYTSSSSKLLQRVVDVLLSYDLLLFITSKHLKTINLIAFVLSEMNLILIIKFNF
jgi:hypothetical protein